MAAAGRGKGRKTAALRPSLCPQTGKARSAFPGNRQAILVPFWPRVGQWRRTTRCIARAAHHLPAESARQKREETFCCQRTRLPMDLAGARGFVQVLNPSVTAWKPSVNARRTAYRAMPSRGADYLCHGDVTTVGNVLKLRRSVSPAEESPHSDGRRMRPAPRWRHQPRCGASSCNTHKCPQ